MLQGGPEPLRAFRPGHTKSLASEGLMGRETYLERWRDALEARRHRFEGDQREGVIDAKLWQQALNSFGPLVPNASGALSHEMRIISGECGSARSDERS